MACRYTYKGKIYEAHDFDEVLKKLPIDVARKFMLTGIAADIPRAPFVEKTDAWVGLAVKRMIAWGVENGYDRIAWTRGEQQVERYTGALRKAVDEIEWTKTEKGVQLVGYKATDGSRSMSAPGHLAQAANDALIRNDNLGFDTATEARRAVMEERSSWRDNFEVSDPDAEIIQRWLDAQTPTRNRTKVVDTTEREDALSDSIGKSMADRIINDPAQSGTISGENIRVDDTGMAQFYDKMVPNIANDILKKMGGEKVITKKITVYSDESLQRGLDESSEETRIRNVGEQPGFDITPEMRQKAIKGQSLFQGGRGEERGFFEIGKDGQPSNIGLLANADRTTFLHESGHFFLETTLDLGRRRDAPPELKKDIDTVFKWWGVKRGEWDEMSFEERRPFHEQFARGFEKYVGEGKAPTPELQSVFDRFKAWLLEVYQTLTGLNVRLNDDVRAVMGRMLGAEVERTPLPRERPTERASLLDEIKKLGGIEQEHMLDITGEKRFGKGIKGVPWGLFKRGGKGVDDLAISLRDMGWPIPDDAVDGGVQALKDMIAGELQGRATAKLGDEGRSEGEQKEMAATELFDQYAQLEQEIAERHNFRNTAAYQAEIKNVQNQRDNELAALFAQEGDAIASEARRSLAENPDQPMVVGTKSDGTNETTTSRAFLDQAEADYRQALEDSRLFEEAANCMNGVS